MFVITDQPSAELNVAGSTTSANCVISDAFVTMCTKNGTFAITGPSAARQCRRS